MPRKKPVKVEIVHAPLERSVSSQRETLNPVGLLERLIEHKVSQAMANRGDWLLEPWFRPRPVASQIRRLQSVGEQHKFAMFYERHGCVRCKSKAQIHAGNGFCPSCRAWFQKELQKACTGEADVEAQVASLTVRVSSAKRLLASEQHLLEAPKPRKEGAK